MKTDKYSDEMKYFLEIIMDEKKIASFYIAWWVIENMLIVCHKPKQFIKMNVVLLLLYPVHSRSPFLSRIFFPTCNAI